MQTIDAKASTGVANSLGDQESVILVFISQFAKLHFPYFF